MDLVSRPTAGGANREEPRVEQSAAALGVPQQVESRVEVEGLVGRVGRPLDARRGIALRRPSRISTPVAASRHTKSHLLVAHELTAPHGGATLAALCLPQRSLAAGFTENLRAAESSLASASADEVMGAIESIATLSEEYGGMPSNELRAEVVNSVRAKRQQLKVFVFSPTAPISPICRTPRFPTSHLVFCLRRMDRRREMSGMASKRSRSPYPRPTPPYPTLPLSTPT